MGLSVMCVSKSSFDSIQENICINFNIFIEWFIFLEEFYTFKFFFTIFDISIEMPSREVTYI